MNNQRRKEIKDVIKDLEELLGQFNNILERTQDLHDQEEEYYDCMPESFQGGEKGDAAQAAMGCLSSAYSHLDEIGADALESLNEAIE